MNIFYLSLGNHHGSHHGNHYGNHYGNHHGNHHGNHYGWLVWQHLSNESKLRQFELSPSENKLEFSPFRYDFVPPVKYDYLNADEAEKKFEQRHKTLNYFSVMLSRKLREDEEGEGGESGEVVMGERSGKKTGKRKGSGDLVSERREGVMCGETAGEGRVW